MMQDDELIARLREHIPSMRRYKLEHAAHYAEQAVNRLEALTAENFKLAAGSCDVEGGKVGDEHGHSYCTLQAKVEALTAALEAHENHMTAGQTLVVKYLVPAVDPDSIGKDEFINRIIGHFDGADQRTVQAKARAALEKKP